MKTRVLTDNQSNYVAEILPDVKRVIAFELRRYAGELFQEAKSIALLDFCRRATRINPEPVTPGKLPKSIRGALSFAVKTGKRKVSRQSLSDLAVREIAIDVARYQDAIENERFLCSTVAE